MRVIPVVDVLGGVVVRAVGGRRGEYRPLRSKLVASVDPVKVARCLLEITRSSDLYVADLDAIVHDEPNTDLLASLAAVVPGRVLIDAGIRTAADLMRVPPAANAVPVFGLETLAGPAELAEGGLGKVLSVDLREGTLMGSWEAWREFGVTDDRAAVALAAAAVGRFGVRRVIVLDLARIGGSTGPGTAAFCRAFRDAVPDPGVELIVGGGVRDRDDLRAVEAAGATAVLVASALHDGTLTPATPAE
jgi:phosphoribosylformimino-5-aminoimidazole carboxamide ribotide isomerase